MTKHLICFSAIWVLAASTASAQQLTDMRRQLDELKQEYQQKIHDLEQRLAALEHPANGNSVPDPVVSTQSNAQIVSDEAKKSALAPPPTFQGQLPSEPSY